MEPVMIDRTRRAPGPPEPTDYDRSWGYDPQGHHYSPAATRNAPRGLKLWEVLFVIAIAVVVFGMVLIPNTSIGHRRNAYRIADGDNLKGLMKAYVAGLADKKRSPANEGVSEGTQFWIALYTTDGADEPSDIFLHPGDGGFLVSPIDPVMNEDEVVGRLLSATNPRVFISGKTISSYNGPTVATMQNQRELSGKIIGCTGDRGGEPIFDNGANVLYGNIKVEFLEWDEVSTLAGNTAVPPKSTAASFLVPLNTPFALDRNHVVD